MKKTMLLALGLQTLMFADSFKHNEQVFTVNTMEIECTEEPKMLYFGTAAEVTVEISKEIQLLSSGETRNLSADLQTYLQGADLVNNSVKVGNILGIANLAGKILGDGLVGLTRKIFSDPEYMYVSECNKGDEYTRLVSLVVLEDKVEKLDTIKELAVVNQKKFIK